MKILTRKKQNEIEEQLHIIAESSTAALLYSYEDLMICVEAFNDIQDAIFNICDILFKFQEYADNVNFQSDIYEKMWNAYEKWKQDKDK